MKLGGHTVPEEDIRRRYEEGVRNLFQIYRPILDAWWLFDASRFPPALIASEEDGRRTVKNEKVYRRIETLAETRREKEDS